jgi:hypothetical protein
MAMLVIMELSWAFYICAFVGVDNGQERIDSDRFFTIYKVIVECQCRICCLNSVKMRTGTRQGLFDETSFLL